MQPVPQPGYDRPESEKVQPTRPRIPKTWREQLVSLLTSVGFWGGMSALVALVSLALPWWGVTIQPASLGPSWGLFFGPQSQSTNVVFFQDRLDTALASNYSLMTGLVILTVLATVIGAFLMRRIILKVSLILSTITVLVFVADVGNAVGSNCQRTILDGASCISGIVGQGPSGPNIVMWGFRAGFYTFILSTIILLGTLALHQATKS